MKVVIQRVAKAEVTIDELEKKKIGNGLMVLTGFGNNDSEEDPKWLAKKIVNLRIFEDINNKMNLSVKDVNGEIMIVSQFTLYASTKKGNRPGFGTSALPERAIQLYKLFIEEVEQLLEKSVVTGKFGANMNINMTNRGPVTIVIDSKNPE